MANAFDLCTLAWGDTEGYVVLSERDPHKQQGDQGYWKDHAFKWPDDRDRVERALTAAQKMKKDVYWAPAVYDVPKRDRKHVVALDTLWADLDEADPDNIPEEYTPAAVWQTSPGRWQALWKLHDPVAPKVQSTLNKNMTYKVGADKGGWGLTKVLRIPDTKNHKYNGDVKVELQHLNGSVITSPTMFKLMGDVEVDETVDKVPDARRILKKYKLPAKAKQLLKARPSNATKGQRSERLWELECLLAEAGMTRAEIVSVVRQSVWNKFKGRHDELDTLFREADKAVQRAATTTAETSRDVTASEDDEEDAEESSRPLSWSEFDRDHRPIRWLVADVWGESEVGFISGMPKTYKSWLALDLAISVATGTRFLGAFQSKKHNVLLIQEEDPKTVMQDRLVRIAAAKGHIWAKAKQNTLTMRYDLPDSLHIISNQGFTITDEDRIDELSMWIDELQIGLLILDPLMMMAEGVDEFKAFEFMSQVLKPLKRLRARTQASIAVVHHHTKASEKSGGAAMYGSVALWAWEESALHLSVPSPGKVTAERFSKHANLSPITIEMGDTDAKWDPNVLQGVASSTDLLDLISMYEGGITLDEVMQATSLSRDAATRQLKRLEESGKLKRKQAPAKPGQRGRRPQIWRPS